MRRLAVTAVAALIISGYGGCAGRTAGGLTLATTTSVGNSGLLDVLLAAYRKEAATTVEAHLVGSGRALSMLGGRQVDVIITHAPDAEATALRAHPEWAYRKFMFNDFVIAGPSADPGGVRGASSAADAMKRIARSGARFISRGDESGTHERERHLWQLAAAVPPADRLLAAGSGMGSTLRVASEAMAYTLTDRATLAQYAGSLHVELLFQNDPELLNSYAVIVDPAGPRAAAAQAFASWLADGSARALIESYRIGEAAGAFTPWPAGRPGGRPEDRPL